MKIKRLIAGGLAAAATGIGLIMGGFAATTFSDGMGTAFFEKTDSTYKSPLIVVGDTAGIVDVIGATDIAAGFVSNYAVTEKSIPAVGAMLSVTGGADLATTATKLYIGDKVNSARQVLTDEDLPTVLESGTFEDDDNNDYDYGQYIYMGERTVTFGNSDEDIDPDLFLDIGQDASNKLYSTKVVFDTAVNFSNADVHGNEIVLFGSKYTVASTSTNTEIVLFGASTKETINAGETKTVTFGGTDYTIQIMGIQDQDTAIVKVDGESEEITEGTEETVSGLTFYVDTVIKWDAQTGEGYAGYVQLSLGSQKMLFKSGEAVAVGEDEEDIDGTEVSLTADSNGDISVIEVKVAASDDEFDYLLPGGSFEDPVWGSFETAFYGMTPEEDSENREMIEFSSSGDYAKVKFTTTKGDTKEVDFGYWGTDVDLKVSKKKLHVVEGAEITENEYVAIDAGGFPHLLLVDNIEKASGTSNGEVKLKDVFSGQTYDVTVPSGNQVNKTIDGQTYHINVSQAEKVRITWNFNTSDTADNGDPGAYQTIFPAIETKYGALVAFAENVTYTDDELNFTGTVDYYVLPGGFECAADCTQAGVIYDITNESVSIQKANDATIIIVEEEQADDKQNSVLVTTDHDTEKETILLEPVMSGEAVSDFFELETDDDYDKLVDFYGAMVTWNKQDDNSADVSYPNDQAIVGVAIGGDPEFSVGGGVGGTYNAAIPITNPVAKFASEITADTTLDKNLVLVGGPCANDLVETLLNEDWNTTDSCDYWLNTHDTLKTSGNGMIKIVEDVFGSGKKALIVAGTYGSDTRNLIANKVIKPTVYEGLSGSEYIGAV